MKHSIHVQDIMSSSVAFCRPQDTNNRAAQLMWEHDCGVIPVVDETEHVIGMVTDRDVCMGAYTSGAALDAFGVRRAMSTVVQSCGPKDSLESALSTMGERSIRRVPVVDEAQHLVGIVSLTDIARQITGMQQGEERRQLESRAVAAMAAIAEPRPASTPIVAGELSAHAAV